MLETRPRLSGGINAFQLKLIAIFGMTLDHVGIAFGTYLSLPWKIALYALGGLTFPIMAFFLTEGYLHTSNIKRYILRLLGFAAISYLPFLWAVGMRGLNVLFTLTLGLIVLYLYDKMKNRVAFWLVFVGISIATAIMDWGLMGVPMVLLYRVLAGKRGRFVIPVLLPMAMMLASFIAVIFVPGVSASSQIPGLAFAFVGCSLTVPLLARYNGKREEGVKFPKYLFYIYYPAHLLALALIRGALFSDWALH